MRSFIFITLASLALSNLAFADDGIEDELASGSHVTLPVSIASTGEITFGYENPFAQDNTQDAPQESHSRVYHLTPSVLFGSDAINRLTSRDIETEQSYEIQNADTSKGYIHIRNTRMIIGAGIDLDTDLAVRPFGAGLGLMYTKNHSAYSEVVINNKNEMNRAIKLPGSFADFSEWRIGEKMVYVTAGSIVLEIGAGVDPIFHAGTSAKASGTWTVRLQKMDEQYLSVSVSSEKEKSFEAELDGSIASLSAEKLKSFEKTLAFNINMRSPKVVEALKKIFKGDFRSIQKLAADGELVTEATNSEGLLKSTGKAVELNLPFLFGIELSKYKMDSYELTKSNDDQDEVFMSLITKEEGSYGTLSNHKKEIDQFSTSFVNENDEQFFAANYKWHYEKDEVKASVVKNKLHQLYLQTGVEDLNKVVLRNAELGHFRISFDIALSENAIFELLNHLKSGDRKLVSALEKQIEKTIITDNHIELCSLQENCADDLKAQTRQQLEKMKKIARACTNFIKAKNQKLATKEFTQLGTILVKNQFLLKEMLSPLKDAKMSLSVEGEKVKKQIINL